MTDTLDLRCDTISADGILQIPGILCYYDGYSLRNLSESDPISTWIDSSGKGNDATGSGATRPIYKAADVNGQPAGEGVSSDHLDTGINSTAAATIAVVFETSGATDIMVGSQDVSNNRSYIGIHSTGILGGGVGDKAWGAGANLIGSTTTVNDGSPHIGILAYDGSNIWLDVDGTQEDTETQTSGAPTAHTWYLFSNNDTDVAATPYVGHLAQVAIWNRALNTAERHQVFNAWSYYL